MSVSQDGVGGSEDPPEDGNSNIIKNGDIVELLPDPVAIVLNGKVCEVVKVNEPDGLADVRILDSGNVTHWQTKNMKKHWITDGCAPNPKRAKLSWQTAIQSHSRRQLEKAILGLPSGICDHICSFVFDDERLLRQLHLYASLSGRSNVPGSVVAKWMGCKPQYVPFLLTKLQNANLLSLCSRHIPWTAAEINELLTSLRAFPPTNFDQQVLQFLDQKNVPVSPTVVKTWLVCRQQLTSFLASKFQKAGFFGTNLQKIELTAIGEKTAVASITAPHDEVLKKLNSVKTRQQKVKRPGCAILDVLASGKVYKHDEILAAIGYKTAGKAFTLALDLLVQSSIVVMVGPISYQLNYPLN
mmetsp:Transcript_20598/g.36197  ORF Transcript_20598/g.36197 Transcript_20598/m.36197 type:complete len:356 (-) Transcript_20598:352-1419(-)